jgi:hypothetical protein
MSIRLVLGFKIVVTLLLWVLPLLCAPELLVRAGIPAAAGMAVFLRLLGAAFLALLLGYCLAYRDLGRHRDITNTVWVGRLSNGLACLILVSYGATGHWRTWGPPARIIMWGSAAATGVITIGLLLADHRSRDTRPR